MFLPYNVLLSLSPGDVHKLIMDTQSDGHTNMNSILTWTMDIVIGVMNDLWWGN